MKTAIILFIILLTAWLLEWFIYEETAVKRKEVGAKALLTKSVLALMFLCAILASYLLNMFSEGPTLISKFFGVMFLIQGLFLRFWTYRLTKQHFTRTIMPIEHRPLYSHGPFRYTRHPFHTGFFLIALGTCLFISGHWLSILFTFVFVGSALHYRMTLEEAVYKEKYGEIYTYWCRHRFRLLPFLY